MVEIRNQWSRPPRGSLERPAAWRPRWRLLVCTENEQRSVSRDAHRRMAQGSLHYNFSANAFSAFLSRLFVVSFFNPVGIELSVPNITAQHPTQAFMNAQDRANASRGIAPSTIYRLKNAAFKAMGNPRHVHPRSIKLTPLPHTGGEVLLSYPNGWTGRGIAWAENDAELALVWQVNAGARALPIRIGA